MKAGKRGGEGRGGGFKISFLLGGGVVTMLFFLYS